MLRYAIALARAYEAKLFVCHCADSSVLTIETRHALVYVSNGAGKFCNASAPLAVPTEPAGWLDATPPSEADNRSLLLFDRGDEVVVQAGDEGVRFLLVSGKPWQEPAAWHGRL